jgi:hypothetical protein
MRHSYRLWCGVVAQLVERLVRNEKVAGSNPVGSTSFGSRSFLQFEELIETDLEIFIETH